MFRATFQPRLCTYATRNLLRTLEHNTYKTLTPHQLKHYTPTNHDNVNLYDISYKNYIATVYPSLQDTIKHVINLSLKLLKMGKYFSETC